MHQTPILFRRTLTSEYVFIKKDQIQLWRSKHLIFTKSNELGLLFRRPPSMRSHQETKARSARRLPTICPRWECESWLQRVKWGSQHTENYKYIPPTAGKTTWADLGTPPSWAAGTHLPEPLSPAFNSQRHYLQNSHHLDGPKQSQTDVLSY